MDNPAEALLAGIERMAGRPASSFNLIPESQPGRGPLPYCVFDETPAPGCLTAVTFGLSAEDHPAWKLGRPELMISVASTDRAWAMAIADIAEAHRGRFDFRWGSKINFHERISTESEMTGFLVFSPTLVGRPIPHELDSIALPAYTVHLAGMYPIYDGEAALIDRIGLNEFWHLDDFDPWDVRRADLSKR